MICAQGLLPRTNDAREPVRERRDLVRVAYKDKKAKRPRGAPPSCLAVERLGCVIRDSIFESPRGLSPRIAGGGRP